MDLLKLGETDKAVSAANGVLRTTNMIASGYKAEALSNISQTFALLDNQETAVSVAEMALEAAKTIGKAENKTGILARVVTPALELTDSKKLLHCALEIIDSTKVPLWERSGCIKMIAEAMCKINDREGLRQALVVADRCDSEWERLTALGSVASYMIKLGEDRQAIAVANQALAEARSLFGDEYDKSAALGAIAMAQARVGTPEGIKRALSVVDSLIPVYRAATLVAVAQFLYASGKKRQASKIISRVSTIIESFRGLTPRDSFALIRLAQALNYLNRKQELNKLVTKVKAAHGDDYTHNLLTLAIASQMNGKLPGQVHEFINDQIENIKDVATNVESNWRRGPVLGILVNGMLEMGYFEQIADLNRDGTINIDELEIKWKKAAQHSMKAQLLAAVGNKSESLSTLLTAIADSREWSRNSLFRVLEYGSEILADIDQGVTLWDIYEAIRNVDSWWHTANDSYFMSHRYLSLRNRMIENFGKNVIGKCSVVTPLSVQLAIDLFVNLQANGRNSLSIESGRNTLEIVSVSELEHASQHYRGLFLQMIEKLGKRMGLHIPSVEFRVDESYRYPGSYTISVNETVVARQQLSYERQLYAGPVQRLHDLKVVGYRTCNPRTGEDAYWILRQNWEKVEDAKGRLWNNLEYIIGHSEAIIGKNLDKLLGYQQTLDMLRIQLPDLFDRMKDNPEDLNSLTIVLKSLLKERVPIVAFEEIADEFMRLKNSNIGLIPITEAMRSIPKICPQLPGNNKSYHFYQLDSKFEDVLNSNFNRSDSHAVLAIEPQQYQRFLASMRNAMTVQWNTALIVNNAFLRPFVKRLIANEFPDIPILSMRELRQDLSSRIVGKIGLL